MRLDQGQSYTVLVADDDADVRGVVTELLEASAGVIKAQNGEEAIRQATGSQPDIILMDVYMPNIDGLMACEQIRNDPSTRHIPIIMFSGYDDLNLRLEAFKKGADDFVIKPFVPSELIARLKAKIRRASESKGTKRTSARKCGNLTIDGERYEAWVAETKLDLSALEFNLLKFFVDSPEVMFTREQILKNVWGNTTVSDRTVDTHIVSLRRKLAQSEYKIFTMYGVGYSFKKG